MQSAAGEVAEEIITATEELIKTGLEVCSESLVITEVGNLSVRLRQHALITRRGARLDRQSPGDLVAVQLDGQPPTVAGVDCRQVRTCAFWESGRSRRRSRSCTG